MANTGNGDLNFVAKLWQTADKMRNNMDAAEYKHVVLEFQADPVWVMLLMVFTLRWIKPRQLPGVRMCVLEEGYPPYASICKQV